MTVHALPTLSDLNFTTSQELKPILIPTSQRRKLRLREAKSKLCSSRK